MTQTTNSDQEEIFIPIDEEIGKFNTYLQSMDRAILSARFGDGKSTFLGKFSEKYGDDYIFFTIYPLNYQVAENKDIFEYIKRDLLMQMFSMYELQDEDLSFLTLLTGYFKKEKYAILQDIIDIVPNINIAELGTDTLKEPIKILINNVQKYKEFVEKEGENTEDSLAERFITAFDDYKGSIYEFDVISQLICRIVNQIKEKENKDVVLVIEDLDRVDPAHIFRILNILSAHIERKHAGLIEWEQTKGSNKFDFDKILLVCDYDNIKHIYHHFYGEKADFRGYISKFSSQGCFKYSLRDKYEGYIGDMLNKEYSKYPNIVKYVVESIVELIMMEEQVKNSDGKEEKISLRYVDDNLRAKPHIKNERIKVTTDDSDKEYYISTINPLTKMLDIINRFDIGIDLLFDSLYRSDNSIKKMQSEIIDLIGCNMLCEVGDAENFKIWEKNNNHYLQFAKLPLTLDNNSIQIKLVIDGNDEIVKFDFNLNLSIFSYFYNTSSTSAIGHCKLIIEKACDYLVGGNIKKHINTYIEDGREGFIR